MEGAPKSTNYKGGIKPVNPNNRNLQIKHRGSTYAWIEERDKRTGELSVKERTNDANIIRVYIRERKQDWSTCPESPYFGRVFTYYEVVHISGKGTEILGRWTEHTTDERRDSFFYRMFNPDHLSPFSFHAPVRYNGRSEDAIKSGATSTRTPYVTIPPEYVRACDVRVDDTIKYTVTNKHGDTLDGLYHVSRMNNNGSNVTKSGETGVPSFIIPLTKVKRAVIVSFPEDPISHDPPREELIFLRGADFKRVYQKFVSGVAPLTMTWEYMGKKYDSLPDSQKVVEVPVRLFIAPGDSVSVAVEPHTQETVPEYLLPYYVGRMGRFDFAFETMYQIEKERRKDALYHGSR